MGQKARYTLDALTLDRISKFGRDVSHFVSVTLAPILFVYVSRG